MPTGKTNTKTLPMDMQTNKKLLEKYHRIHNSNHGPTNKLEPSLMPFQYTNNRGNISSERLDLELNQTIKRQATFYKGWQKFLDFHFSLEEQNQLKKPCTNNPRSHPNPTSRA